MGLAWKRTILFNRVSIFALPTNISRLTVGVEPPAYRRISWGTVAKTLECDTYSSSSRARARFRWVFEACRSTRTLLRCVYKRVRLSLNAITGNPTNRNEGAVNDRSLQVVVVANLVQAAAWAVESRCHSRSTLECTRDLCKSVSFGTWGSDASLSEPVIGGERLNNLTPPWVIPDIVICMHQVTYLEEFDDSIEECNCLCALSATTW